MMADMQFDQPGHLLKFVSFPLSNDMALLIQTVYLSCTPSFEAAKTTGQPLPTHPIAIAYTLH